MPLTLDIAKGDILLGGKFLEGTDKTRWSSFGKEAALSESMIQKLLAFRIKKLMAEKTEKMASLASSTSKIIMKNPDLLKQMGLSAAVPRHELQNAVRARVLKGDVPDAVKRPARRARWDDAIDKSFGNYAFRATSSTPYGTSPTVQEVMRKQNIPASTVRDRYLWAANEPSPKFGDNVYALPLGSRKASWRVMERTPLSVFNKEIGRVIKADVDMSMSGLRDKLRNRKVGVPLGSNGPPVVRNKFQVIDQALKGNSEPLLINIMSNPIKANMPVETVLRRADYPESAFERITQQGNVWRTQAGRPVYGNRNHVNNNDFYYGKEAGFLTGMGALKGALESLL